jgi:hypothetical protein
VRCETTLGYARTNHPAVMVPKEWPKTFVLDTLWRSCNEEEEKKRKKKERRREEGKKMRKMLDEMKILY